MLHKMQHYLSSNEYSNVATFCHCLHLLTWRTFLSIYSYTHTCRPPGNTAAPRSDLRRKVTVKRNVFCLFYTSIETCRLHIHSSTLTSVYKCLSIIRPEGGTAVTKWNGCSWCSGRHRKRAGDPKSCRFWTNLNANCLIWLVEVEPAVTTRGWIKYPSAKFGGKI